MVDAEEVRSLVREGRFVLTRHAAHRMQERLNKGRMSTCMEGLRAAIRNLIVNGHTRRRPRPGGLHLTRMGVEVVVDLHDDPKWGRRAVVITVYRQGGGTMPRCAFED
jgi:hypothetical protein